MISILFFALVVPHVTDKIQKWVESVAKHPVTDDGAIPEVIKFNQIIKYIIIFILITRQLMR